jgi:hypothetical protein
MENVAGEGRRAGMFRSSVVSVGRQADSRRSRRVHISRRCSFFQTGNGSDFFFGFGVVSCKVGESCRPRADSNREDGVGHFSSCNHVPNVPSCLLNTSLSL